MGGAAKPRCSVVLLMALTIFLSLGLPAEDVLDAVYDECEALPCEAIPLFSTAGSVILSQTTPAIPRGLNLEPVGEPLVGRQHSPGPDTSCSAGTRPLFALLCILLC
jgi:hypothetical protein